jgi:predicted ABC-type sugar transport system permease subunit
MSVSDEAQEVTPADAPERDAVPAFQRFMERIGNFWTLGVLILLIVIFGIFAPSLYTKAAWLSTSSYAVEYLILAVGQTALTCPMERSSCSQGWPGRC